jgi:large subunit ribosomal protein L4
MIRQALLGALSDRARGERLHIVSSLGLGDVPSTKTAAAFIQQTAPGRNVLVVISRVDEVGQKSVRNIPGVHAIHPDQLNAYDVLNSDDIIFTQGAYDEFVAQGDNGKDAK